MASDRLVARHVFHPCTSGGDRLHAWQEATGEPFFVWGKDSNQIDTVTFGALKRAFKKWLDKTEHAQITIYHDGIGADALGPLDKADNKLMFLHNWFPRWEKNLEWMLRCTGQVLVGHPESRETIRRKFGWIPEKYIYCKSQPAIVLEPAGGAGTGAGLRTGIWLQGKSWKRHGNRLRAVIDRWSSELGELEVITKDKPPSWAANKPVIWSHDMPLQFALMRIHTWDSCLLLNDFSLDMPWLIRALELDCFPLVPEGSGGSKARFWRMDKAPQPYEWGDLDSAISLLMQWREQKQQIGEQFRDWAKELACFHRGDHFQKNWNQVKQTMVETRAPKLRPRKPVGSFYPVGWYERVQRLRAGI